MRRIRLRVAYDGTAYCGWQVQPEVPTIEGELNQAISRLTKEEIIVIGASRTDAGVHAKGNVAVFDTESTIPADRFAYALNPLLPEDIVVVASDEVEADWHPRHCDTEKTYEYKILNSKFPDPMRRRDTYHVSFDLDLEKMREAAGYLKGEHDFKSFCANRRMKKSTVRTIYSLTVTKADDLITIRISGSGFLYNMVRIIAGTLVKIGMGVYPPEKMEEILEEKNRAAAGPTIPARGLTLVSLEYEKELAPYLEGENKHWHYVLDQRNVPEKGLAYLTIERCEPEELDGVLRRVIHQAYRNGAKRVFVRDTFGEEGSICGYYRLRRQPETEEGWLEAVYEGEHR